MGASCQQVREKGAAGEKAQEWRRAILLRFEISDPLRVIWVMTASIVMPKKAVGSWWTIAAPVLTLSP
jgi:hypothetical protein